MPAEKQVLQILYLPPICNGYLQHCNQLIGNCIQVKRWQMADTFLKSNFFVEAIVVFLPYHQPIIFIRFLEIYPGRFFIKKNSEVALAGE